MNSIIFFGILVAIFVFILFDKESKLKIYRSSGDSVMFGLPGFFIWQIIDIYNDYGFWVTAIFVIITGLYFYWSYKRYINHRTFFVESNKYNEIDRTITEILQSKNIEYTRFEPFKKTVRYIIDKTKKETKMIDLILCDSYYILKYEYIKDSELIKQINSNLEVYVDATPFRKKNLKEGKLFASILLFGLIFIEALLIYKKFN